MKTKRTSILKTKLNTNNNFRLFVPDKKFRLNNDELISVIMGILMVPSMFEFIVLKHTDSQLSLFSIISLTLFPLVMLLFLILSLYNMNRYKPLQGKLTGEIVFSTDNIIIGHTVHNINNIINIDFKAADYMGFYSGYRSSRPRLSNGVNNTVALQLANGKKVTYHFQVLRQGDMNSIRVQLINYHLRGKLHWLQLLDILGYSEYEDIQEFKKEVSLLSTKINFLY